MFNTDREDINKNNKNAYSKFVIFSLAILLAVFCGGYVVGRRGYVLNVKTQQLPWIEVINRSSNTQQVDFSLFWQVWDLLQEKHIDRPLNAENMLYGAIQGLADSLGDPYTTFLPPEQNELMKTSLKGEYEGIGAELGIRDNQLIIVAPLEGSPAEAAGVRSGDQIIKVDGEETITWSVTEAVSKIRGKSGTEVALTIQRGEDPDDSFETLNINIVRGTIDLPSIKWEKKSDNIYYIRLSRFGDTTIEEWDVAVEEVVADAGGVAPNIIILDVRSNPGGYLDASIYIASEFIRGGNVLLQELADGRQVPFADRFNSAFSSTKSIVLIDEGSASASEIVAAALQDRHESVLVGKNSFGKGTIQDSTDLKNGSGLHITVTKWLTPKGFSVDGVGLIPDYEIELTEEDISQDNDLQLIKALEIAELLVDK